MDTLLAQSLAFAAVMAIILSAEWALRQALRKEAPQERVAYRPPFFEWFALPIGLLGPWLHPYVESVSPLRPAQIRQDLVTAALQGTLDERQVVGGQAVGALLGGAAGVLAVVLAGIAPVLALLLVGGLGFIGWSYPGIWLRKRSEFRKQAISRQLPYALDLLTTAVEAGQDFNAALRYLTRHGLTGPLAEEMVTTLGEIDLGQARPEALRRFSKRIPTDEVGQLVSSLIQSMETGSSLSGTLRMLSQDLRRARFHRAERQAAKAPSLMILPMVMFIVPGIFIIVFTPVILRVMEALGKR